MSTGAYVFAKTSPNPMMNQDMRNITTVEVQNGELFTQILIATETWDMNRMYLTVH
jgi:hypothetical protein